MPSSVTDLFAAADLVPEGVVPWGTPVPKPKPGRDHTGVYVVALTPNVDSLDEAVPTPPYNAAAMRTLLSRPQLQVDGVRATPGTLAARLVACWLSDEVVVYVGRSSRPIHRRVDEYYKTRLGARSPHKGGWPVKTLALPLFVHYATTPEFVTAERYMLDSFAAATDPKTRSRLHDPARPIPYANLRWEGHGRKAHGIGGACD